MQQRILIVKRGAMGDVLMATPFLRQLRTVFPKAQIDFLTTTSFANVLTNNPTLTKIISVTPDFFNLQNSISTIRYFLKLRHQYDYVFALDKHYYFNFLISLVGGISVGFVRESISRLFLTKYITYNDISRYHALYYLDLLGAIGHEPNYNDLNLDFFSEPITEATERLLLKNKLYSKRSKFEIPDEQRGLQIVNNVQNQKDQMMIEPSIPNYIVVINSGGNNAFEQSGIRMLPSHKIIEILTNLLKTHPVILIGSSIDENNYDSYIKIINNHNLYNLAGILSLSDSAHILKHATNIYTTDCGAMHLAISQNCQDKMVCFFGPTNPNHVLPPDKRIITYWDDQDIYDPRYALTGRISKKKLDYFTKLNIQKLILRN
jgi:ADP-heptose:LPS heptosyltransferase